MAFRLKYSQIGPGFLAGLRVRTLLTVGLWRRLNNRWHGTRMGRYGARHRPYTCRNKGTGGCNLKNPGYFRCVASIESGFANERKVPRARVNIIAHISAVQTSVAAKPLRHRANMHISYAIPEYRPDIHVGFQGDGDPGQGLL